MHDQGKILEVSELRKKRRALRISQECVVTDRFQHGVWPPPPKSRNIPKHYQSIKRN
jgi:hypothetical protein